MPENDEPGPAGFGIPSIYSNRFSIRFAPPNVRISFGEAFIGKKASFHTSVTMTVETFAELMKVGRGALEQKNMPPNKSG